MPDAIAGLQPQSVWKYFAEISRIPRGSKNEAAISRYVYETAGRLGLQAKQDSLGNVVVKKPAAPGKQDVRPICLQGHLDMVCEKNADKAHDFAKDHIELVRKGDALTANGTTLGADNGIAVATNLAIMEDRSLAHGPLELLFTIDEETGLTGASNLAADFLESRTLLNLDSEEEGELCVGCAGGMDTLASWKAAFEKAPEACAAMRLMVSGLHGGHSGVDIHEGRGNAIKIANRVIIALGAAGARLAAVNGGNKRNAIPRECTADLFIPESKLERAKKTVARFQETVRAELASVEKGLAITLAPRPQTPGAQVLKKALHKRLCRTISALPHGVIKMSADIPGLVETSTNVAVISTQADSISLATSQRSSVASEISEIAQTVAAVLALGGARVEHSDGYPGWKPNLDSPILKLAAETYQSLFGKAPAVKAIHAGLECGILGERVPGMDMVSLGPTLKDVHTPEEKISIDSVERYWRFLLAILGKVS